MAKEAEFNREQEKERVDAFSLMEPVGKLAAWPKRLRSFFHDVRTEMRKVTAPSWKEVQGTTVVVVITVFLFGLYFAVIDYVIQQGVTTLFNYFKAH